MPARKRPAAFQAYRFWLPLVADGRLAFAILLSEPGRATVERLLDGEVADRGYLKLIDNQWTCVWHPQPERKLPDVRLIGSRFALGDSFGVRPVGGTIELFEVRGLEAETRH